MLERIWSGWRASYVGSGGEVGGVGPADEASVFTRLLTCGLPDEETHILHRGRLTFALLNAFPYSTGHVLVLPYREVAELEDLTGEETAELWAATTDTVRAVKTAYRPEGINVGLNLGRPAGGSVSQHLHVHVVPRWTGDANFMTAVANTRTMPEPLVDTAARLRAAWPAP
jgi:ATP adenylyltransferase